MLSRATTPVQTYILPETIKPETIEWALWTYKQKGKTVIEKELADLTISGQDLSFMMTQEETNRLVAGFPLYVQLRIGIGEKAYRTNIVTLSVGEVLNDTIMPR